MNECRSGVIINTQNILCPWIPGFLISYLTCASLWFYFHPDRPRCCFLSEDNSNLYSIIILVASRYTSVMCLTAATSCISSHNVLIIDPSSDMKHILNSKFFLLLYYVLKSLLESWNKCPHSSLTPVPPGPPGRRAANGTWSCNHVTRTSRL